MRDAARGGVSWSGVYLVIGLLFQILYFGVPWPFHASTWLHVLGWPIYVVLGMLRRLFIPFAFLALIGLGLVWFMRARRAG